MTPVRAMPRPSGGSASSRHTVDVPDRHACDVGDRIGGPGLEAADPQAELAKPRAACRRRIMRRAYNEARGVYALEPSQFARCDRAGTTSMLSMSSKRPGVTTLDTGGDMKRRQSRARDRRPSRHGRYSRGDLGGVDVTARDRERRCGRRIDRGRERDPAHRHDELHRLVQPLELHRGTGTERDDHGLPAAHGDRLFEEGGVLRRSATGRSRGRSPAAARSGRSSCGRTRSGPTASR